MFFWGVLQGFIGGLFFFGMHFFKILFLILFALELSILCFLSYQVFCLLVLIIGFPRLCFFK